MIESTYFVIVSLIILAVIYSVGRVFFKSYFRFRGKMLVTCPETKEKVAVDVDAKHAALTSVLDARDLRLTDCTRWPARQDCGQECIRQIESSPEDYMVRVILTRWYQNKRCIYCGRQFEQINWHDHKPALRNVYGDFVEWSDLPVEKLPRILDDYKAVCWNCYIAEDFRRQHPELVVDRPARKHHSD
ncbi:hypothetical protein MJD09_05215 [bacterium]|nr:hypothetical protein [bacterium]